MRACLRRVHTDNFDILKVDSRRCLVHGPESVRKGTNARQSLAEDESMDILVESEAVSQSMSRLV